jgi:hypothetical protein
MCKQPGGLPISGFRPRHFRLYVVDDRPLDSDSDSDSDDGVPHSLARLSKILMPSGIDDFSWMYECVMWKILWDGGMEVGGVENRMKGQYE